MFTLILSAHFYFEAKFLKQSNSIQKYHLENYRNLIGQAILILLFVKNQHSFNCHSSCFIRTLPFRVIKINKINQNTEIENKKKRGDEINNENEDEEKKKERKRTNRQLFLIKLCTRISFVSFFVFHFVSIFHYVNIFFFCRSIWQRRRTHKKKKGNNNRYTEKWSHDKRCAFFFFFFFAENLSFFHVSELQLKRKMKIRRNWRQAQ